jgi:hypothetical protein
MARGAQDYHLVMQFLSGKVAAWAMLIRVDLYPSLILPSSYG